MFLLQFLCCDQQLLLQLLQFYLLLKFLCCDYQLPIFIMLWLPVIMYSHIVIAIIHQLLVFNNFVLIHNIIHSMLLSFKHWLAAWHIRIQIKWFKWHAISSWLPSYACSFRFSVYTVQNPRVVATMLAKINVCVPLTIQLISLGWNRMSYMYMWAAAIYLFR